MILPVPRSSSLTSGAASLSLRGVCHCPALALLPLDTGTARHMDTPEALQAANMSEGHEVNRCFFVLSNVFPAKQSLDEHWEVPCTVGCPQWDVEPNRGSQAVAWLFLHFLEPHTRSLSLLTNHGIQESSAVPLYCCVSYRASTGALTPVTGFSSVAGGFLIPGCLCSDLTLISK